MRELDRGSIAFGFKPPSLVATCVNAAAQANGARTTKEPSPHERNEPPGRTLCWAQVAANVRFLDHRTNRPMAELG
jgi:hypothetical protein